MKITPKENYLRLGRGEDCAYIPRFTMMGDEYLGEAATKGVRANLFPSTQFMDGGYDMWGVRHVAAPGTNNATMPDVRVITIEDITEWEKVLFGLEG